MEVDLLRVPYALAETGELCSPMQATKSVKYYCPECHELLILRAGRMKRWHFAHRSNSNCQLNGEGWVHLAAKYAVYGSTLKWIHKQTKSPEIERECSLCKKKHFQQLPNTIRRVEMEYRVETDDGLYIADIGLLDDQDNLLCVVELRDSHEVDDIKQSKLNKTPWIEVYAKQVLETPYNWIPIKERNLRKYTCLKCRKTIEQENELIKIQLEHKKNQEAEKKREIKLAKDFRRRLQKYKKLKVYHYRTRDAVFGCPLKPINTPSGTTYVEAISTCGFCHHLAHIEYVTESSYEDSSKWDWEYSTPIDDSIIDHRPVFVYCAHPEKSQKF